MRSIDAKHLEKLLPVVGSIVLFVAWAVQQLLFADWNAARSRIGSSEAVFHAYRATNGVFRALRVTATVDARKEVEQQQLQNYERGLTVLAFSVDPEIYAKSRALGLETLSDGMKLEDLATDAKILFEFEAMQRALSIERSLLSSKMAVAERAFLWLYAFGTLLVICGGVAKLVAARVERNSA